MAGASGPFPDCRDARGKSGSNDRWEIVRRRAGLRWRENGAARISLAPLREVLPRLLSQTDGLENLSTQSSQRAQRVRINYFKVLAGNKTTQSGLRPLPGRDRL